MKATGLSELIDQHRPYLEIEISMLRTIRAGIMKLIKEIDASEQGIGALIRIAAYTNDVMTIDAEIAMRN